MSTNTSINASDDDNATRYRVEVRGEWAGGLGGWRPAVAGTLNQSGMSDADASTFEDEGEAARREAARLMVETPWSASDAWVSAGACDTLGLTPRWREVFLRALDRNVRRLSLRAMA